MTWHLTTVTPVPGVLMSSGLLGLLHTCNGTYKLTQVHTCTLKNNKSSFKNVEEKGFRTGEMSQQLRALAALLKDLGSILRIHMAVHNFRQNSNIHKKLNKTFLKKMKRLSKLSNTFSSNKIKYLQNSFPVF